MPAPNPSITTNYTGEFAGKYIAAAILSAPTLEAGAVTIMPNVKYRSTLKVLGNDYLVINNASCDFEPEGNVELSDKVLQVDEKQVNVQLCKTPFQSDWEATQMGYSAFDNLPKTFSDFFIGNMLSGIAANTETYLWTLSNPDSFTNLLVTDGAATPTWAAVDATNVINKLGLVVDSLPNRVYNKPDLKLYVSINVAKAYVRALGGFATNIGANGVNMQGTQWYTAGGALSYEGIAIFVADGMDDDTIVLSQSTNLYFGCGLMSDFNEVRLLDMADLDGSKNVRFIARWTQGTQVGFGGDSVVYADL
jgi:hypothetical protein